MVTVCLSIYRKKPYQSVRRIEDYKSIKEMKKAVEFISKFPDVIRVDVEYKGK